MAEQPQPDELGRFLMRVSLALMVLLALVFTGWTLLIKLGVSWAAG